MRTLSVEQDRALSRALAERVKGAGGRVYYVGGCVRDALTGTPCKDIDLEVYGVTPAALRGMLEELGAVVEKGASFGVLGLRHSDLDIAMPRTERRTGDRHRDFDVAVDPFMSTREASRRRDFTINAMMQDVLTGEITDHWGGREDLERGVIRCVSADTFPEDALRVFRAAQFAARFDASIDPDTLALCRGIDVRALARERVFDETCKALMKADRPSVFFYRLREMDHLREFFPEVEACAGIEQSPVYHPEGDVFTHTMLVTDQAARLRDRAKHPLWFMLSALLHDLGKCVATTVEADGRITSHGHEVLGLELVETQLRRLTSEAELIRYVLNQTELHMRPNMLAARGSRKARTRAMFDLSVCPEDLILLSKADASGKLDKPYDPAYEQWLNERLSDYRECIARPMVTGQDLIEAGVKPGPDMGRMLKRARQLHFGGMEKKAVLRQVLKENSEFGIRNSEA